MTVVYLDVRSGKYSEVHDEKAWFDEVKKSKHTITVFYRNTTKLSAHHCEILEKHFQALAKRHLETRFLKMNAEKCEYLAQKLLIVLLPTIIMTKDNFTEDRIEGFEELGGTDSFSRKTLCTRLAKKGAIRYDPSMDVPKGGKKQLYTATKANKTGKSIYQSKLAQMDDDNWDDISSDDDNARA